MALIYAGGLTSTSFTTGYSNTGWQPEVFLYGGHIDIPSTGTVTQLGAFGHWGGYAGNIAIKLGLYNSAGTLIGQSTSTITSATGAWYDSGAVSLAVTTGTYYVLLSGGIASASWGYSASGAGTYATEAYATAMAATETMTIGGDAAQLYGVRLDFTAGGSSNAPRAMYHLMQQGIS